MINKILHCFTLFILICVSLNNYVLCQNIFGGSQRPTGRLPGVGQCDAIVTAGVANCLENYLPKNILSSFNPLGGTGGSGGSGLDICCRYSKYRACISGLHAGLTIAMQRERCPKSYSTRAIKQFGESFVGLPLKSYCGTAADGKSRCPPSRGSTKPKRKKNTNKNSNRRTGTSSNGNNGNQNPLEGAFGGLGGLGGGSNPLGGIGGVFQQGTSALGQGAGSVFNRGTGGLAGGGAGNPLADGLGGIGSVFGGKRGGLNGAASDDNPIAGVFKKGTDTLAQGAQTVLGGFQNIFGQGLGGAGLPPL